MREGKSIEFYIQHEYSSKHKQNKDMFIKIEVWDF